MAELVNTFSWSISAAEDFEECRRKRYWAKYAMWGGWKESATPLQRTAYRLCKMDNRFSIMGEAVELAVMWALRQKQSGTDVTADQAYEAAARPFLNAAWKDSKSGAWQQNPKRHRCLWEHYYGKLDEDGQKRCVTYIVEQSKACIAHFLDGVLPSLAAIRPDQELPIRKVDAGDPESFEHAGIKVYAIPDYAYREGDELHIHDWKAGKPKDRHRDQLAIYGLWAHLKHGVPPERISVHIQYLAEGVVESKQLTAEDLADVQTLIGESVADMADYLVDGDIKRNLPQPQDVWDLAPTRDPCRMCSFYELCRPELE